MNFWDYLHARDNQSLDVDQLIARTQRNISNFTLVVIGAVLLALFLVPKIDATVEKLLYVVLGGLLNVWATQNGFWFGRPRGGGIPDPTVTTTTTTPTAVTTTTSPSVTETKT